LATNVGDRIAIQKLWTNLFALFSERISKELFGEIRTFRNTGFGDVIGIEIRIALKNTFSYRVGELAIVPFFNVTGCDTTPG
jgi:hypothetical protein